jgi:hypothetical protein
MIEPKFPPRVLCFVIGGAILSNATQRHLMDLRP